MPPRWIIAAAGSLVVAGVFVWLVSGIPIAGIRTFYVASEAMEPTLQKGDRFIAAMARPKVLQRGQIVLVKTSTGDVYVKRLAALGGDRISLTGGFVAINGKPVHRVAAGSRKVTFAHRPAAEARLYHEQFPGERGPHAIQDLGPMAEDDVAELTVQPGRVFLLGDNRDDSADSRVSRMIGGLEQVPVEDVVGHPVFFYWPPKKVGSSRREWVK